MPSKIEISIQLEKPWAIDVRQFRVMVMKVYKYIRSDSNRHLIFPEHKIGDGFIMRKKMNERKRDGIKLVLKIQKKATLMKANFLLLMMNPIANQQYVHASNPHKYTHNNKLESRPFCSWPLQTHTYTTVD